LDLSFSRFGSLKFILFKEKGLYGKIELMPSCLATSGCSPPCGLLGYSIASFNKTFGKKYLNLVSKNETRKCSGDGTFGNNLNIGLDPSLLKQSN